MQKSLVRKGLALGIIILFVGASVVPSITGTIVEKQGSMVNTLRGNTFYVGGSGPGNYTRIQDAINDSSNGDTVFVYDDSSPYCENIVVDKAINLIGEDRKYTIIDGGNIGSVVYVSADWVNITGFTIKNRGSYQDCGIKSESNFNCFSYNTISYNFYGIRLSFSSNNTITGNNVSNNNYGIYLDYSSNNTITGNNVSNNNCGLLLSHSSNNTITGNNANSNSREGICLTHSSNNMIISNNASNNNIGIGLFRDTNNKISDNTIAGNKQVGVSLWLWCNNNNILKNNFLNNTKDAFFFLSLSNTWNQNYWGKARLLPKPIFGIMGIIPWVNFDWHPAKEPYKI